MSEDDKKIVQFISARDRGKMREIDADQAQWDALYASIVGVIVRGGDTTASAVTSATLRALLDALEGADMNLAEAKAYIAARLKLFR